MGFDDLVNKAKDALNSDQGKEISDNVLDGVADAANKATDNKFEEQIKQGRDAVDGFLGKQD